MESDATDKPVPPITNSWPWFTRIFCHAPDRCPGSYRLSMRVATLQRWQKESEFQKALREARRAAFGQAVARLQQMSGAAVATLRKMMVDQAAPAFTRVRAAECIINHAV